MFVAGDDEQNESLVTLVVAPVSEFFASIPQLTTSRVAGLQDFFTHYKPDQSPIKSTDSQASSTTLSSSVSDDLVKDLRVHSGMPSGECLGFFLNIILSVNSVSRCPVDGKRF